MVSTAARKVCVYENLFLLVLHTHLLSSMSESKTLCLVVKARQLFERQHHSKAGTLCPYCCCIPFLSSTIHVLPAQRNYQFWLNQQERVHAHSCKENAEGIFFPDTSEKIF